MSTTILHLPEELLRQVLLNVSPRLVHATLLSFSLTHSTLRTVTRPLLWRYVHLGGFLAWLAAVSRDEQDLRWSVFDTHRQYIRKINCCGLLPSPKHWRAYWARGGGPITNLESLRWFNNIGHPHDQQAEDVARLLLAAPVEHMSLDLCYLWGSDDAATTVLRTLATSPACATIRCLDIYYDLSSNGSPIRLVDLLLGAVSLETIAISAHNSLLFAEAAYAAQYVNSRAVYTVQREGGERFQLVGGYLTFIVNSKMRWVAQLLEQWPKNKPVTGLVLDVFGARFAGLSWGAVAVASRRHMATLKTLRLGAHASELHGEDNLVLPWLPFSGVVVVRLCFARALPCSPTFASTLAAAWPHLQELVLEAVRGPFYRWDWLDLLARHWCNLRVLGIALDDKPTAPAARVVPLASLLVARLRCSWHNVSADNAVHWIESALVHAEVKLIGVRDGLWAPSVGTSCERWIEKGWDLS